MRRSRAIALREDALDDAPVYAHGVGVGRYGGDDSKLKVAPQRRDENVWSVCSPLSRRKHLKPRREASRLIKKRSGA